MRPDIVELTAFYCSRDGEYARRLINHQLRQLWPDITAKDLLGIGFATPFLGLFEEARASVALMPATQGGKPWPADDRNLVALGREDELPFDDRSFDYLIMAHAYECSPHANRLMREAWRVLKDGGRMAVIVPNRRGLWCWSERTPFGFGQPFSKDQLERSLKNNLFAMGELRRALYMPPLSRILPRGRRLARRLSVPVERLGLRLLTHFSGVLIAEAIKDVYSPTPELALARPGSRRYLPVPEGVMARGKARSLVRDGRATAEPASASAAAAAMLVRPPRVSARAGRSD
jgi:SAM-dependent methyltransferase